MTMREFDHRFTWASIPLRHFRLRLLGARLISDQKSLHIFTRESFPERAWRSLLALRADRLLGPVYRRILPPKTWSDHVMLRDQAMGKQTSGTEAEYIP
jgi:hypothetical protein